MFKRSNAVFTALLVLVAAGFVAGLAIVVFRSFNPDHRPPPLELADALESSRAEVEALLRDREFARAEAYLDEALPLAAADLPRYHDMMGRALSGQPGRLEEAVAQFRLALQLEPALAEARNNLALAYARQGKTELALEEVREALRIDPGFGAARQNLALIQATEEGLAAPPGTALPEPVGGDGLDLARGREFTRQFYRGELLELHKSFAERFAAEMPLESLSQMQREVDSRLGRETELLGETIEQGPGFRLYVRTARFAGHEGEIDFVVQLNTEREISGLQFRSANSESSR